MPLMPDLTPITVYACISNENWQRKVEGSQGKTYTVCHGRSHKYRNLYQLDFSCDCPSYKFREGYCKHIEQVKHEFCGWNSLYDEERINGDKCPRCGDDIYSYKEMV